jgi:hypothetical protein
MSQPSMLHASGSFFLFLRFVRWVELLLLAVWVFCALVVLSGLPCASYCIKIRHPQPESNHPTYLTARF